MIILEIEYQLTDNENKTRAIGRALGYDVSIGFSCVPEY